MPKKSIRVTTKKVGKNWLVSIGGTGVKIETSKPKAQKTAN